MSLLLTLWLSAATVLPRGVILVKGATPSASDPSTPLPEQGIVLAGRYRNGYFGLSYPIPAGWKEQPAGPPPSDGGAYVLSEFARYDGEQLKAHVLVTAQDFFFSPLPAADAKELIATARRGLAPNYRIDSGPDEVTIAGRHFYRLGYMAPRSGLRWRILSTDVRCHALTFTFTGADTAPLDDAERAMSTISMANSAPPCVKDYARDNVVEKTEPQFDSHRFNTIPVRVLVDAKGRVKHIHLLSAFPEQSQAILTALRTWRFKPYRVDGKAVVFETGLVFGMPMISKPSPRSSSAQ
jgi:hypothetical protein